VAVAGEGGRLLFCVSSVVLSFRKSDDFVLKFTWSWYSNIACTHFLVYFCTMMLTSEWIFYSYSAAKRSCYLLLGART